MTRKEIAKDINYRGNLTRILSTNAKLNFCIGDTYDNRGKVESWKYSGVYKDYKPWNLGKYKYKLECRDVPCHKVDYNNSKECELLNCLNCNGEFEVLVLDTTQMEVISIENENNKNDSYIIKLKFIGFKK